MTAECSLEFCCFQHLPASIFIVTVSSASPKGPQDHFLLIFVKTRERSVYSKRCHELADAAGQAWGRRGQPVWGPPGAEAVVWPGRGVAWTSPRLLPWLRPRPARTGSAVRNPATFCVSLPLAFGMALSLSL